MAPSQLKLCEWLLLLKLSGQSNSHDGAKSDLLQGPSGAMKVETRSEMTILNTICMLLQTDEEGDRVVAAMDRHFAPPHLILARSIPVTQTHIDTTHELLTTLQHAQTDVAKTVFPIIYRNHLGSLQRKIHTIHTALLEFYTGPSSYPAELTDYEPKPKLHEEFIVACTLLDDIYPQGKPGVKEILFHLLQHLIGLSSHNVTGMTEDRALVIFLEILNVGRLLRFSRLFQVWANVVADRHLRRALDGFLPYANVLHVHNAIQRWYATGDLPFRWINITNEDQYHQAHFHLSRDPITIISDTLSTKEPCSTLYDTYPGLQERWAERTRTSIHTRLHPEMQIVLDLSYSAIRNPPGSGRPPSQRAIGTSGESCICCVHWIKVFNLNSSMRWTLNNSENPAPLDETWRGAGKRLSDEVLGPNMGGKFTPDQQVFDFVRSLIAYWQLQKFDTLPNWQRTQTSFLGGSSG